MNINTFPQTLEMHNNNEEPLGLGGGRSTSDLLRLLECPICNELQVAPIYNCELGHSVCNDCRRKIKVCPTCTSPFTQSRNYLAESIAETVTARCVHYLKGCQEVLTVAERHKHLQTCIYRPVLCQLNRGSHCNGTEIELSFYLSHLKTAHDVDGRELTHYGEFCMKTERIRKLEDAKWPPFYIVYKDDKKQFLKNTIIWSGSVYSWLTLISVKPEEAEDFQSTIIFQSKDSERLVFTYSVPVHHFRRHPNEVIESGECAALPLRSLTPFCRSEYHQGVQYAFNWDMQFCVTKKLQDCVG